MVHLHRFIRIFFGESQRHPNAVERHPTSVSILLISFQHVSCMSSKIFRESAIATVEYMTRCKIMLTNGNRGQSESFKKKKKISWFGNYCHVKSPVHTRIIQPQIMGLFFNFETKNCDLSEYMIMIQHAMRKLGEFI